MPIPTKYLLPQISWLVVYEIKNKELPNDAPMETNWRNSCSLRL